MKKAALLILALRSCSPCPASEIADTIWHEARGEGRQGIEAVASVIYNRAKLTDEKPADRYIRLKAVCLARKQFSCHNQGYTKVNPRNEQEAAILAFCEGLEEQMISGAFRITTKADHYLRFDCFPSWRKDLRNQERIGLHIFGNCN